MRIRQANKINRRAYFDRAYSVRVGVRRRIIAVKTYFDRLSRKIKRSEKGFEVV
jgi:hypothetical protein